MFQSYDLFSTNPSCSAEFTSTQQAKIQEALVILEAKIRDTACFTEPSSTKQFCQLHLATAKDEHFACLFLDNQHRMIAFERLFRGTVDSASVHPRVVVRRCLELNAAAIIFSHNHPSGMTTASQADIAITRKLKDALALVDIRVLDHIIVGIEGSTSMAEGGLI